MLVSSCLIVDQHSTGGWLMVMISYQLTNSQQMSLPRHLSADYHLIKKSADFCIVWDDLRPTIIQLFADHRDTLLADYQLML